MKKIVLGDEIEDVVTKVRGIAHGRVEYLDGTVYWIIQPQAEEGAIVAKEWHAAESYCKRIGDGVRVKPKKTTGFRIREQE